MRVLVVLVSKCRGSLRPESLSSSRTFPHLSCFFTFSFVPALCPYFSLSPCAYIFFNFSPFAFRLTGFFSFSPTRCISLIILLAPTNDEDVYCYNIMLEWSMNVLNCMEVHKRIRKASNALLSLWPIGIICTIINLNGNLIIFVNCWD